MIPIPKIRHDQRESIALALEDLAAQAGLDTELRDDPSVADLQALAEHIECAAPELGSAVSRAVLRVLSRTRRPPTVADLRLHIWVPDDVAARWRSSAPAPIRDRLVEVLQSGLVRDSDGKPDTLFICVRDPGLPRIEAWARRVSDRDRMIALSGARCL